MDIVILGDPEYMAKVLKSIASRLKYIMDNI